MSNPHPSPSPLPPLHEQSLVFVGGRVPSKALQLDGQPNPFPHPSPPDDAEYLAKYKDMKRKVKQIELENDRIHLKCLKIRKNIQRLRLERAILYERLSTMSATEPLFPCEPAQLPGTYPQPPAQAQEQRAHPTYPSDIHPGFQADTDRLPFHAVHQPRRVLNAQGSPPMDIPRGAPQQPLRHYPQHPRDMLQTPHPQTGFPAQDPSPDSAPAPTRRNSAADTQNQSLPPPKSHEIRNGGARTFPFVLEYPPFNNPGGPAPASYPSEIRFHQYDASDRPVHRNRRDFDRDPEKAGRYKRRPQESEREYKHSPPDPQPPSPPAGSLNSSQGGYAYPLQHPFLHSERDPQPRQGAKEQSYVRREIHPDKQQRYEDERLEPGNGDAYHRREYECLQGERSQGIAQHSPVNARTYPEPDEDRAGGSYDHYKSGRDDPRARTRSVEDEGRFSLPHVQVVDVMD